jgi:hypothetical protein
MANLLLHIGMPKAGSSSIQMALDEGRAVLAAHGVGYLSLGKNHSSLFEALYGTLPDRRRLRPAVYEQLGLDRHTGVFEKADLLRLFEAELAANTMPTFVASGERLFGMPLLYPGAAQRMADHLRPLFQSVRIIAYVREPAGFASSRAQQIVKNGHHTLRELTDPAAIRSRESVIVPRYRECLTEYMGAFGDAAVEIREFSRDRFVGGDLIVDFCTVIGAPALAADLPKEERNASLSLEAVTLLDSYNAHIVARDGQSNRAETVSLRRRLADLPGARFALPPDTIEQVKAEVADDVAWLRKVAGADLFSRVEQPRSETPAWSEETTGYLAKLLADTLAKTGGKRRRGEDTGGTPAPV